MEKREIKFRAWDVFDKTMKLPTQIKLGRDLPFTEENNSAKVISINCNGDNHIDIFHEGFVLMQYTGLKDSNGKEIYEGDVICHPEFYDTPEMADNPKHYGVVKFEDCAFRLYGEVLSTDDVTDNDYLYVAGNIYENPELIKEEKC